MTGTIATIPKYQFLDSLGVPLVNGTITTYLTGTTTLTSTWQDQAQLSLNTNPIVLDARGEATLWLDSSIVYKFVLANEAGAIQWTQENISGTNSGSIILRADLAASSGSSIVGFLQSGAGAVATTVQAKMREGISVEDFGAVGDGVTDDTAAIQLALNTGRDVLFPDASYKISASLIVGNQRLNGSGGTANRTQTILNITGNFPAFINKPNEFISFQIDGFFIQYGDTLPTLASGNDEKYGFKFTGVSHWPEFIKISNCTVKGGWGCWYDNTGTYESILEQVFSWNCRTSFYKQGGTTIKFDTCMSQGAVTPFHIDSTLAATLINCSADQCTVVPLSPYSSGCIFSGVRSLSIIGWDSESNFVNGDSCQFMLFDSCSGSVSGFVGYNNKMACAVGQEVYFFKAINSTRMDFTGSKIARNVGDLEFTGTGGNCFTLVATSGADILVSASEFYAPTGGTPTNRYSIAGVPGTISYLRAGLDNNILGDSIENLPLAFVPILNGFVTSGVVSIPEAIFSKQGRLVNFTMQIQASTIQTTALASYITGLPFLPSSTGAASIINGGAENASAVLIYTDGKIYLPTNASWGTAIHISGHFFTT